jgi:acyl carrier protein
MAAADRGDPRQRPATSPVATPPSADTGLLREVSGFLSERGKAARGLSGADVLTDDLGLSSLEVVELVTRLGAHLGLVPNAAVTEIRTIEDLCALYRSATRPQPPAGSDLLEHSRRRAEARRLGRPR